jgi:flagellar basal body rod protein FlgB
MKYKRCRDEKNNIVQRQHGRGRNEMLDTGRSNMNLPTLTTDNITEVLLKIIEFTQNRQKILIQNINTMHSDGFVPRDLPVDEFSKLMAQALAEHACSGQLILRDGQNVKFGANGTFETIAAIDEDAKSLFELNRDEYLRKQIDKMLENSLNQRIAADLLKQKQTNESCPGRCFN